jgi:phosphoglycolate phosphatase
MDLSHIKALIFDLDGTLIDSERDLIDSTNAMLRELDRPELPDATISGYIGHGAAKLVASAIGPSPSAAQQTEGLEIFLHYYQDHKLDYTHAYPGVPEALKHLFPMPMAVLTNKPLRMSTLILDALDLSRYFVVIYGGDSFSTKKPDPLGTHKILAQFSVAPNEVLFVGDSEVDVQTARNSGTVAVTVNYGFGTHDRVAYPADIYIDSLAELTILLRKP